MKERKDKVEDTFHLKKVKKIIIMKIVKLVRQADVHGTLIQGIHNTGAMEEWETT